ncbi:MAG TPA: OstA-like protein, partial [Flavobacteriales bacterium]|nr:OstA-like protein [Flavobacteriales bacterium]
MIKSLHILITFLLFGGSISYAQNTGTKGKNPPPANVELLNADKVIFDQRKGDAQRALGNVQVRHDNTLMYCDSAWIYQKRNVLFAFGHLHVKQGDSLNMYGDSLFYDGNTGYGKLRGHIRMVELDMSMETDSLEFVSKEGRGWYSTGGIIRSAKNKNVLTSKFGEYRSASKDIFFSGEVMLKHPDYTMTCDTLRYHTPTETAWFYGPT